jgi:hypothetical protein
MIDGIAVCDVIREKVFAKPVCTRDAKKRPTVARMTY